MPRKNTPITSSYTSPKTSSISKGSSDILQILAALRTKPFVLLAGISGTGKSRIVRKLAQASTTETLEGYSGTDFGKDRWKIHKPENFELIQVKPNWHNSLEVVGYKSNIGGAHYEFTPFVEFLVKAWRNPQVPFFLCLDEMNLAPVEQYFAEFLSAIESRSLENGEYETDPIIKPFKEFGKDLCDQMLDKLLEVTPASKLTPNNPIAKLVDRLTNKGLTLPQNLMVIGTVNMDETTFSFSRKVLDRAMSIVMNDVNFDDFFSGATEDDVPALDDAAKMLLVDRPIKGLDLTDNDANTVKELLQKVNSALDETPFKLGYRASNEALLYVSASNRFGQSNTTQALDEFAMMKILSRIEGDNRSVGNVMVKLQTIFDANYPQCNAKLKQMKEDLDIKHFASYWG